MPCTKVPLVPDPQEIWKDPLYLLERDTRQAYSGIEDMLISPHRTAFWIEYVRTALQLAAEMHLGAKEAQVPEEVINAIEEMGFVPAAEAGIVTPEFAAALLRNVHAIEDLHRRISASHSRYWSQRRKLDLPLIHKRDKP